MTESKVTNVDHEIEKKEEQKIKEESKNVIEVIQIDKSYGDKKVLDGVSFKVKKGTIHGFVGPNGAGKSTVMNSIVKLTLIDKGEIRINGNSIYRDKYFNKDVAYVPAEDCANFHIEVEDLIVSYNVLRGLSKEYILQALDKSALAKFRYHNLKDLSTGWSKIALIWAKTLSKPKILILDEPTNGIDPDRRFQLIEQLKRLREEGTTILLSSHVLLEIQPLLDEITMIKDGKIVYTGPKTEDIEATYHQYFIEPEENKKRKRVFEF